LALQTIPSRHFHPICLSSLATYHDRHSVLFSQRAIKKAVSRTRSTNLGRILVSFLLLLSAALAPAKTRSTTPSADHDYVIALATADRFLHAWQTDDEEAGILMLTDQVKQQSSEDAVHYFFSSSESARASYEIGHGRKLAHGRYEFPVALFLTPSRSGPRRTHAQTSALIVVKAGKADWAIDKLP
jgi:hypothetical protein